MGTKVTKVKPKISNGKAESSSSSDSSSSSSSHTEKKAPVKSLQEGQYSAVPPPASMESKNNKAQALACKNKLEKSDKKKQVSNKRITAEGPVAKQQHTPKSVPLPTQKEEDSSESDSDSSSEEDKKVIVKVSVKSAATKDSDSSENEVPVKSAGIPDTKTAKKRPVVTVAEKANGNTDGKKVPKKGLGAKTTKPDSKSSMPASKASSSDSSSTSSDEEEKKKPAMKPSSSKLAGGSNVRAGKEAPLESSSSSDSSSDEEPKKAGTGIKKKVKDSCSTSEKKKSKTSSNLEGKIPALKNLTSDVASVSQFSSSGEEAVNKGLPKKKRKREEDQESETPDNKKMKPRTPHTFPKMKRQSSPFRRVKAEEIEVDARVANNSFDAKKGASGDWGEKANEVLKFTKGKSFRHEKTKKKRGSYCGGSISTEINSIKFESD
ncbi:hypothetical protein JD844_031763 [Phrynosoma platyrhinos]|uniref:Srp40 C-terminal domain-containing protein n=1 Tax=Phrynosoma platyrhinos TaxID=52577 RepID=A0ABQ7T4I0_PHRPL|nr:hypothetical protein JD844_031763 [Phrynosoma platyrhinos]